MIKYIEPQLPKRHRPRSDNPKKRQRNDYYIRKKSSGKFIRVCSATFQSITQISPFRIKSISAYFLTCGASRPENRGGSRMSRKDQEITESIMDHIKSLKCRSSHYGRKKSIRGYLPPELSVRKLYKMWCDIREAMHAPKTSFSKYYKIFSTKFNLGFGNPRTDVCSFCELKNKELKCATKSDVITNVTTELKLHKLRAKKFYELLKKQENDDGVIKVCFDMQQNQPLPKLSISDVYYMRQLWLYNLTFVVIEPNQNKQNTFAYTWTENESGKGSNEVGSALIHFLKKLEQKYNDLDPTERPHTLKLFSDSCPGQNKNSTMVFILLSYVQNSMFDEIQHYFPIRGHSFMPPDRVFGRSEKVIRKKEKILGPQGYYDIFSLNSTVMQNSKNWTIKDLKGAMRGTLKSKLPFKLTEQRVFTYKKGSKKVTVRNTYTGPECSHAVLKTNNLDIKTALDKLKPSLPINKISVDKKANVLHLLKHLDLSEEENTFYKNALKNVKGKVTSEPPEDMVDDAEPFI